MPITIIIIICLLLLLAYLFDLTSSLTKIPSVILLLILGWACRQATDFFSYEIPDLSNILPIFGTVGLILIVLEGALELDLNKSKLPLVRKSFLGSLSSMLLISLLVSVAIYYSSNTPVSLILINVIPICIISSSVAISSARNLKKSDKEFVIYESSLSDILGVVFFNFILLNSSINFQSFLHFGFQLLVMGVISFVATIGLSFLLRTIDHPIKHAPIIILVILIYAVSEIFHLPALIFILFFGLFLNNIDELQSFEWIKKLNPFEFNKEVKKFREIVTEGAFLVRAFFFTLFGFSFETKEIINLDTLGLAVLIFSVIVIVRAVILKFSKLPIFPLLFVAPRGLITILLFFAIPATQVIHLVNKSLIIQVIILTVLFMMIGLIITGGSKKEADKATENEASLETNTEALS
ncbi:MAG: cation:proton antiporter [Ginsengibacter sp.]|jgi:NhaP-type Na+/H+ or K+/H+ antiporter